MPELAEVKLTSEFISKHGGEFVKLEKSPVSKVKTDLTIPYKKFILRSKARGKELIIDFIDASVPYQESTSKRMKVTLGMSGAWIYYDPSNPDNEKYHKHAHLRVIDSKGMILALFDIRRFAKWSWSDFDFRGRGPCPFSETSEFSQNLRDNWQTHKDFKKHTLSEILMNQRWFNGVGNYLRAEILYRLDSDPFMISADLDLDKLELLVDLTINCIQQAYKLGGGQLKDWKNPDGEDPSSFREWIKCYSRLESTVDRTGRTFWFDKKWKKNEDTNNDTVSSTRSISTPRSMATD
jgi:endonuclease VIII-like 1